MPSTVDSPITDSVSQVNTKVLGDTPATAMGNLMMTPDGEEPAESIIEEENPTPKAE